MESVAPDHQEAALQAVMNLAKTCDYDMEHSHHVTRLSLRLFDELKNLHNLGPEERKNLQYAGLLHDIGWVEGRKGHHKASLKIILATPMLPFDSKERLIIGSIARYHRKGLPDTSHDHFAALNPEEQAIVRSLAALLRVADGLDSTHQGRIRYINCKIKPNKVVIHCASAGIAHEEEASVAEKSDLFQQVFNKKIEVDWKPLKE
jgi:exopolyphosphatase/pppGpp-phosphohydrolase